MTKMAWSSFTKTELIAQLRKAAKTEAQLRKRIAKFEQDRKLACLLDMDANTASKLAIASPVDDVRTLTEAAFVEAIQAFRKQNPDEPLSVKPTHFVFPLPNPFDPEDK